MSLLENTAPDHEADYAGDLLLGSALFLALFLMVFVSFALAVFVVAAGIALDSYR